MFIAFDGTDGAGKTSLCKEMFKKLKLINLNSKLCNMGSLGYIDSELESIRNKKFTCPAEIRELLYYFEGNLFAYDLNKVKGTQKENILIDRYLLSYYSYGPLNGIPLSNIKYLTQHMPWPDIYFFIDVPPEIAIKRILSYRTIDEPEIGYKKRLNHAKLSYDNFIEHQSKVHSNFLQVVENSELQIITLDGTQPLEVLSNICWNIISQKLFSTSDI